MTQLLPQQFQSQLCKWATDASPADFHDRIVSTNTIPLPSEAEQLLNEQLLEVIQTSMHPRSVGQRTSLAPNSSASTAYSLVTRPTYAYAPSSTASYPSSSSAVPRLTRSIPSASSSTSRPATSNASFLDGGRLLEVSSVDADLLELPTHHLQPYCDYPCLFEALDCTEKFVDAASWQTHVLSHFRGQPTPPTAKCWMCDEKFPDNRSGRVSAWQQMMVHLAIFHFRQGHSLATARPDFDLYRWLYSRGVIDVKTLGRLQLVSGRARGDANERLRNQTGNMNEPVFSSSSRAQERRDRARNTGIARISR